MEMSDEPKNQSLKNHEWVMLIILTISSFFVVLDFASIFIPLPSIMEEFHGAINEGAWIIVGFILAFSLFLLISSSLAENYGNRKLFILGIIVFTLSSVASALAPTMGFLICARVVMGIGAALVEYSVYALIKSNISFSKQEFAFTVQGTAFITGALLAPVISGAITTLLSWEFIFWLNVIAGAIVFLLALKWIPSSFGKDEARGIDISGFLLCGASLFILFFTIIEGPRLHWNIGFLLIAVIFSAFLFILFIKVEKRVQNPMIDLTLFKDRLFRIGNILRGTSEFTSMGIYFVISHFLQVQLGYSALFTGVLLMAVIVGGLLAGAVTEPLSKRMNGRWLIVPGYLLVAGGTFWFANVTTDTEWLFFLIPLAVAGAGFTAQEGPTLDARDKNIPSHRKSSAWRLSYSIFLLGIGLGVAVVSSIWQSQFLSGIKQNLSEAELPAHVIGKILPTLVNGGVSGNPAADIAGSSEAREIIQMTFSNAVNASLLSCVVIAVLGAGVALLFSDKKN
ncbi:MFS transporter [Virgibacillus sp. MSP4-1]|uniref:MFS transporter n=1 Tax=Virgibacillus sp. MSP4-1 TaxID=2700081 RepID=UPI00039F9FA9|nr:MFS transporter [Virgibacillus sp. MSP4-1]QHS21479.1 MFS transporter [Virgibacillus sp. MSP4-1]